MNFQSNTSTLNEDIIVEELLLRHDPDGRWLDSKMLLQEVETILSFVAQSDVRLPSPGLYFFKNLITENCITNIDVFESKETLPYAISRISTQMLCPCVGENDIQTRTMVLFDLLVVKSALACLQQILYFKQSQQIDITELKEKVTLLLLSKPQLLPVEPLLLLLQQLYDHPFNTNTERNYEILWIPIPSSQKWTNEEKGIFDFFSNALPWISVRQPWLTSSTVLSFLRTEWPYQDGEAMVVVIDSKGRVVNMNAMDMVLIWGVRAFPFSVSREDLLWEEDGWSMQLLLDGIHPAFETWKREGREICIFGSDNSDWVDEFKSRARKIQNQGFQFELIYLSKRRLDQPTITFASAMNKSSINFSPTMQQFFWLRLESIKRSKLNRSKSSKSDRVFQEVTELLDFDYCKHKGWAIIGKGSTAATGKIVGEKLMASMRRVLRWGEHAAGLGLTEAIKIAEDKPCEQTLTVVSPFEEGSTMRIVTCEKCKRPMKKFIGFQ